MKKIIILLGLIVSAFTNALTVDTMLKISDDNGTGVFSISNDLDEPSFIKIKPSKIIVTPDGNIKRELYTESNMLDWEIALTQMKVILDPKRVKNIGVRSLCSEGCDRSKDNVFALKFLPSPYRKDGQKKSSVSINYGYEPLFVIPAREPVYKYTIERIDNNIKVNNKSNSLIRVFVNQCNGKIKSDCSKNIIVLAGRNKRVSLPVNARQNELNLNIMGYDNSFYKKAALTKKHKVIRE
ncbi:hypothetical protein [Photobacterium damselae]|uniref:hypothetical protein n=1 Tax=Photobacterium damselae TaxID=38293 RepID=UPI001302D214|nr:hypothetical protein [Photobacterium damselae]